MLTQIEFKTIETSLLTPGEWVLDGGCLGFGFALTMVGWGMKALAVDPSPDIAVVACSPEMRFARVALTDRPTVSLHYAVAGEPEANYTRNEAGGLRIPARTISELMAEYGIDRFAVVKLNIEGAEYDILANWPGPIAEQITVSFHDFLERVRPDDLDGYYERMLAHLDQWYRVVQHERTPRGEAPEWNHWDSLFVLKDT